MSEAKPTIAALRAWLKTCPLIADEQEATGAAFRIAGLEEESTAFSIGELSLMMAPVFVALGQACREVLKTNVLLEGRTNLLYLPEYEVDSVKRLLHFLEQRGELAKLIGAQKEKLGVLIGGESNQPEMIDTSVVMVRYSMGRQTRGTLGVIGPTRMDYPKIVSNLQYLAQSVGGMLNEIMDVGV